ncbi:MAG: DUF1553 domain-containing protein [Planctomycetales bacterium]|nr:DUF1553 domain-containing protein [Planctomycetales bacterium]
MGIRVRIQVIAVFLLCQVVAASATAQTDFVRDVRPIFQRHCYVCHGGETQKSGLRLDIKSQAFKGGELYGPSVIAGDAKESPLIQFVSDRDAELPMPPDGDGLSASEIETLARWVNEGAAWPDGVDLAELKDLRDHWSFHPLREIDPPTPIDEDWATSEIDRFVLHKLESAGLKPADPQDRGSWLRRVYLDLIGIPPTPEQVASFVSDDDPLAYDRAVDQLLDSPRYGERWAQHWLDVVRFADTHGFEVNTERPNAWPYRDYVIRAFNKDTPYDQFIREQLVGDAMGEDAATGFLVTASVLLPGQIGKDAASIRLARQDAIDEIVVNIGQTFLGLSVGCARCHDHKFDPVSQREYYSMQAFVAGVEYGDRDLRSEDSESMRVRAEQIRSEIARINSELASFVPLASSGVKRPMINARLNIDRFASVKTDRIRFTINSTNKYEPCIDEIEVFDTAGENIALASAGAIVTSSGNKISPNRHELRFVNDGQYGNSRSWMSSEVGKGWIELTFPQEHEIDRVHWGRDRQAKFDDRLATDYRIEIADGEGRWMTIADASDRISFDPSAKPDAEVSFAGLDDEESAVAQRLVQERERLESELRGVTESPKAFAGIFRDPDEIHLLTRGDPEMPKELVSPAVPSALGSLHIPPDAAEQTRRKELAEWLASADNPLTARVMVNRIWQGHFGVGFVRTANDFGHIGEPPSHPELLDWLASEFIRSGWSIKQMHRMIVLSSTYRQASTNDGDATNRKGHQDDADNRLLWRYPSRRVDAETIRDSMLAASGELGLQMFGRGFDLFDQRGGLSGFTPVQRFGEEGLRRMIYAHKVRRERDAIFGAFDCPDAGQSTAMRRESTTPIQALNLFNSQFTLDRSDALADRVAIEAGDRPAEQVQRAYQLVLTRDPTPDELVDAETVVRKHGLPVLCRVLFNANEFLSIP